ncbi:MAG: ankyrin repeat domain-containing protein [Candidatus Zixiibacteriota bacterium]|nr:MAG: ankyrin repeat domain-containing protein [candidate division Zixibacteria bacterium]
MNFKKATPFFLIAVLTMTPVSASEIHDAAKAGDLQTVKQLTADNTELISSTDRFGRTALHWACRGVHPALIGYLLETGADVNVKDRNGIQPLHSTASRGHSEAVALLIDKGASVDARSDLDGGTPLHYAAENGHREVVKLLLSKGASITAKDMSERTALHLAAWEGQVEVLERLCDEMAGAKRSNLDIQDFDGCTSLHLACAGGQLDAARTLISKGVNVDVRNAIGKSAFNLATEGGFSEITELLASSGANQGPAAFPKLRGPYLGQTPPGRTPRIFAKGIVSTSLGRHSNIVFSPDLNEATWRDTGRRRLVYSRNEGGVWSAPTEIPFKEGYSVDAPVYSADGNRLYFMAGPREASGMVGKEKLWYIDRGGDGWLEATFVDSNVNSIPMHFQFSVDSEGNIYTGGRDIYCARNTNGSYDIPEALPAPINTDGSEMGPFISPDGSYLIFNRVTPPPTWSSRLLISFRTPDGTWSEPLSMDELLGGWSSIVKVSPDGKYLFFLSRREGSAQERSVYWVEASILEELKQGELQ